MWEKHLFTNKIQKGNILIRLFFFFQVPQFYNVAEITFNSCTSFGIANLKSNTT